jgi:hypothetical protein
MILLLRAFNWTSLWLLFLWSWYYLGSQAVYREYLHRDSADLVSQPFLFQNPKAPSLFENPKDYNLVDLMSADSEFNSQLVNPPAGHDAFGAALVPYFPEDFPNWWTFYSHGWFTIVYAGYQYSYPSAAGEFFYLIDSYGNVTDIWVGNYDISTSYVFANCSQIRRGGFGDFPDGVQNSSIASFNATGKTNSYGAPTIDMWFRDADINGSSLATTCALYEHFADVQGNCDGTGCAANKVRRTPETNITTPFDKFLNSSFTQLFLDNLLFAGGPPTWAPHNQLSSVLALPPFWQQWDDGKYRWNVTEGLAQNSDTLLQDYLIGTVTLILNTYLSCSQSVSPVDYNNSQLLEFIHGENLGNIWLIGHGKGAPYNPEYHLSKAWLVVDILTCIILLAAAICNFWLRRNTIVPDIFGYVSSMTRDNPHMPLPEGGSTMSGVDRAIALRDINVKLTDLHTNSDVGRIVLTTVGEERHVNLNKSKHYV